MKKPFVPKELPIVLGVECENRLHRKVVDIRVKINRFDMMLERSPVSETAMMFFSLNESVESTKIEGTQATFDEVVESQTTGKINTDIQEVNNYLEALSMGEDLLKNIPISTRMFHQLHKILLKDSRGENRSPGEYRKIQNFIGPTDKIKDASYIPPEPQLVAGYMGNLEKYINDEFDDDIDPLIKAGIIHAQFETIHPFLDGNGRLGRILIMLYLLDKKVISKPSFFISEELEKNKFKYYAMLNNLRSDKPKWEEWLEFFLVSASNQADKYINKLERVEELYYYMKNYAEENNIDEKYVRSVFNHLIFTVKDIQNELGVSYNAALSNIKKLADSGKIFSDNSMRNKIYRFYDLLDVLRG